MDDRIPAHWQPVLERANFDSARGLAERANVTTTTVMRMLRGQGRSKPENVNAVRVALGLSAGEMSELMGRKVPASIDGPPDFGMLSRKQQTAVVGVIKAMLEPENLSAPASTNIASINATKRRQGRASESESQRAKAARRGTGKPAGAGSADDH